MDRDIAIKLLDAVKGIEDSFEDIVTSLATIATNTTPADDSSPAASVSDSRSGEEPEEEPVEETRGGKK